LVLLQLLGAGLPTHLQTDPGKMTRVEARLPLCCVGFQLLLLPLLLQSVFVAAAAL
jgi:hypothetical protein